MRQLKWGMKYFCEKWGSKRPEDLKSAELRAWIDSLPLTTRGRWNVFAVCRDFFNSPIGRQTVARNPFDDAPPKREKGARLPILTLDQMRALLAYEWPEWFKAWLVAGAFAGLRTREVFALDNSAIDWEYKEIVVRREDAKQGKAARPRSASIQAPFERHMPRREGPMTGGWWKKGWERTAKEACAVIGVEGEQEWPTNCLRHSFASYHWRISGCNQDGLRNGVVAGFDLHDLCKSRISPRRGEVVGAVDYRWVRLGGCGVIFEGSGWRKMTCLGAGVRAMKNCYWP